MDKDILFNATPKQTEFLTAVFDKKHTKILYGGAIRGGKTYGGLGAIFLLCKAYPKSRWAIVRDSLMTLKRNTIPAFNKIKPTNLIQGYNQDTQTVTLTNGSQILFFAENYADDKELNRWKGLEVNGFLLEEANELQEVSFYKAIERAGSYIIKDGKQPKPLVMMTCNPSDNWVKELFYNRWKDDSLPDGWLYIPSRVYDNPFIANNEEYMKSLKDLPKYQYEVFVEGNWDIQLKTGGEFYKCFELEKHVAPCEYDPLLPLHISWDDNVNPYLPVGIFQIQDKSIKCIDEIAGVNPNNTITKVCDEIKRRYGRHIAGMFVYGDATAQKDDTKLEKGHNFYTIVRKELQMFSPIMRISRSNPSVVMRGAFINTIFEKEYAGISVRIDDSCKHVINDFTNLKEASDGTKAKESDTDSKTKVRYQKYGHFTDLFDYMLCYAFLSDFLDYQRTGTPHTITSGARTFAKHKRYV